MQGYWCMNSLLKDQGNRVRAISLELTHAAQAQRRSPTSHPKDGAPNDELARVRSEPAQPGNLTLWITPEVLTQWQAPRRSGPGGQLRPIWRSEPP